MKTYTQSDIQAVIAAHDDYVVDLIHAYEMRCENCAICGNRHYEHRNQLIRAENKWDKAIDTVLNKYNN
jgi:hypothetical protein